MGYISPALQSISVATVPGPARLLLTLHFLQSRYTGENRNREEETDREGGERGLGWKRGKTEEI